MRKGAKLHESIQDSEAICIRIEFFFEGNRFKLAAFFKKFYELSRVSESFAGEKRLARNIDRVAWKVIGVDGCRQSERTENGSLNQVVMVLAWRLCSGGYWMKIIQDLEKFQYIQVRILLDIVIIVSSISSVMVKSVSVHWDFPASRAKPARDCSILDTSMSGIISSSSLSRPKVAKEYIRRLSFTFFLFGTKGYFLGVDPAAVKI